MWTRITVPPVGSVAPLMALALAMVLPNVLLAASPSELLEKAIYTEETVGNLDEAIKLYEQVVAEGKAGEHAAADAQYRLGSCYLKQGKQTEAMAAFRTLIEQHPNEKELVAKAEKHLPSKLELLPEPWTDGERLQLNMKLPTGLDIGTMIYAIDEVDHDGTKAWQCSTRGVVTVNDAASYSMVLCDKDGFAPIRSHWMHSLLGTSDAVYKDKSVEINVVGKKDPITIESTPPVFDNEQAVELFRRLPLAEGYKVTIPIVAILTGNKIDIPASVTKLESLTVPSGTFECFKIELGLLNQTFWISTDEHRYVVRFSAGGVTADLAKIEERKKDAATQVRGDGYSFTLPNGWFSYKPEPMTKKKEMQAIILIDPKAEVATEFEVRPIRALKKEQQVSMSAWVESLMDELKNAHSDLTLREPGPREITVDGQPATTLIADYMKSDKKMAIIGVAVFGKTSAATLHISAEADKVDEMQKVFDQIVNSLKLE